MRRTSGCLCYAVIVLLAALLAACTDQREPARTSVGDIDAMVDLAAPGAAQRLPDAAAAKKNEWQKALNEQWSGLAAALPGYMTAIHGRIDLLGKQPGKRSGAHSVASVDLNTARVSMRGAESLWSKAQAAFASGNLEEAVATAKRVQSDLEGLASILKVDLSAPAEASARSTGIAAAA